MRRAAHPLAVWISAAAAVFLIVVLPGLNAFAPVASALHLSDFTLNLYGKYLCYAVLALSVDLLWGYTGLLSLGQCVFFALGGYMMGMYLMRMIGSLGQYHQPIPDFLVFLGWSRLPAFWRPFANFPFALGMVLLVPGLLALVFGYLAFRSRIRGVYFAILTQALTYAASGLPTGLKINSTTGVISGTTGGQLHTYTVTVKATDPTGAHGTTSFSWTIHR